MKNMKGIKGRGLATKGTRGFRICFTLCTMLHALCFFDHEGHERGRVRVQGSGRELNHRPQRGGEGSGFRVQGSGFGVQVRRKVIARSRR
ncbi:MAG TPA: hypothetical protein PLI51_10565 [bacterium]|nr:hypothetical protein [bacterium]HPQ67158.1 hypothetical protein [bacterium]